MLFENQKIISNDIYKSLTDKKLYNIPTGRGKTVILLDVAKQCLMDGKNIIISVSNNTLVRDMHKTAIELLKLDPKRVSIVIGHDNYISRDALNFYILDFSGLQEYVTLESFQKYIEFAKEQDTLYFDDFESIIEYTDTAHSDYVHEILSVNQADALSFNDVEGIIITNHFYFISKANYSKEFKIENCVLLIDEVHDIAQVAESILSENFSIFEFKNILYEIKKEVAKQDDFRGKSEFLKTLQTLYFRTHNTYNKLSNPGTVGQYEANNEKADEAINASLKLINCKEFSHITKKKFYSARLHNKIKSFDAFGKNIADGKYTTNGKNVGVYFSPNRGYPTIRLIRNNVLSMLDHKIWKQTHEFAGVSTTVTCSFSPNIYEVKYGYERLGMLEEGKEYNIKFYDRLFPKENVTIHLPPVRAKNIKSETVYDDNCSFDSKYYNYLVEEIYYNHNNKNAIILCGWYKEATFIAELYKKRFNDRNIITATSSEKTVKTLARFKKEGGLLFATRNYNTGISLEGELLEKLFILKLPYPDFTKKKWQELKQNNTTRFSILYYREMLITLMQTLGRLQRTKDDVGDIHLLDPEYFKKKGKLKKEIDDILSAYGVISEVAKKKKENFVVDRSVLNRLLEGL
jgi:Rad3-related DNA helicase